MILQISASAGSGKTYALTLRFLELLDRAERRSGPSGCALHGSLGSYSLQEILAATFTNKAAAEMKERVLRALKQRALDQGAGSEQGRAAAPAAIWVDHILRHFGALNIRTIDSLLFSLVRLSALELGLPPDFVPSFSPGDYFDPIYDALMEDLAMGRYGPPGRAAAGDAGFAGLRPVEPYPQAPPFQAPQPGEAQPDETQSGEMQCDGARLDGQHADFLRARLAEACRSLLYHSDFTGFTPKKRIRDLCRELTDMSLRGLELPLTDSQAVYAAQKALHARATGACSALLACCEEHGLAVNATYTAFLRSCAATPPWKPLFPSSSLHAKENLDDCLNKASRGLAPEAAHKAFAAALEARRAYSRALPLFAHALRLSPLTHLAGEICLRMDRARRETGLVAAPLLPHLAALALDEGRGVSDAMCRMGSRLSHLLLDEFQDTSREQWQAILPLAEECLSTGGSLTYVGDAKQAIYAWRGGDVRLFDEAGREPRLRAMAPGNKERLPCNWRSHPAIVRLNNAFFSLLRDKDCALPLLAAMLPDDTPPRYVRQAADKIMTHFADAAQALPPEKDWSAARAMHAGARLYEVEGGYPSEVRELVRERLRALLLDELLPRWSFSDIAILVRSGEEGALAASWLTDWGLPVVTENSFLLASHPLVGRLTAFLTFLDYPPDDAALMDFLQAEFLRDFTGMPDGEALDDWAARVSREYGRRRPPLYRLLRRDFPDLWRLFVEPFHNRAGLMSAYDTLSEAMERFGLWRRYPDESPFLRRLLELAHLAETGGHSSLAAFLAFWREAEAEEKLPLPEHMDAVRIMTIHKAKGLEFNVVILPFQHSARRHAPPPAAARVEGVDMLTRALPELPDIYYPACVTDELERLNLLYVAWTRPVYALHAFITRPARRPTPLSKGLALLCALFKERHGDTVCQWELLRADQGEDEEPETARAPEAPLTPEEPGSMTARATMAAPREPGTGKRPEAAATAAMAPVEEAWETPVGQKGLQTIPPPDASWRPMAWLPRLKIFRSPLEAARFSPRQRGILFHLCLENLHLSGPDSLEANVERAVKLGLRLFPLALSEPDRVAEESRAALLWFASLPESALWMRHGQREQSIMDEQGRLHRVDLLVDRALYAAAPGMGGKKGDGPAKNLDDAMDAASKDCLLAIDYKSGGSEQEAGEHREQVQRYIRLLRKATGRETRGLLIYLDERRLAHVAPAGEDLA